MSRRLVLVWALLALSASPVRAQMPFPVDLLPKREALSRVGLERAWKGVVPLSGNEKMISLSFSQDLVFARTSKGFMYTFNAETGQLLWHTRLGEVSIRPFPASTNSFAVFVTNLNYLFALDKKTGKPFWKHDLGAVPASAAACDEKRVMVGMATGKLYGFNLKVADKRTGKLKISDEPIYAWNWQTHASMDTRPLPAGEIVVFGSDDGTVYVAFSNESTMLYRFATGGAIGDGFGTHGNRLLLVPSADKNLYGIDILTSHALWTYASGAVIDQEPLVADDDIFVVNTAGRLSSIDPDSGTPKWTTSTHDGQLVSVGEKRLYLESRTGDLFMVDRTTGQLVSSAGSTGRAGLNLRQYDLGLTNRENDRLYFATQTGLVICLREKGKVTPHPLRDPKLPPFATVPAGGITPAAPTTPPAEAAAAAGEEKAVEEKPAGKPAEKPAEPPK
jgi:outer membrane protein assembly factor BamB